MTVTARKELQSASRLALGTPVVAYRTARAQLLGMHAVLQAADAPRASATAPRRESNVVGGAMTQCREEEEGVEVQDAGFRSPLPSPYRSYNTRPKRVPHVLLSPVS